jgi:hypothetical protein
MDIFSKITTTVALIVGAAAGLLVGGLLAYAATTFYYRGLSLPLPFTERRLTVLAGEIGREVAAARTAEVAKCDADNLRAQLAATEHLLEAANRTIEQDRQAAIASQAKLSVLGRAVDDYEEQLEREHKAKEAADEEAEKEAKANGTKIIIRDRCPAVDRAYIDRLRHVWGQP